MVIGRVRVAGVPVEQPADGLVSLAVTGTGHLAGVQPQVVHPPPGRPASGLDQVRPGQPPEHRPGPGGRPAGQRRGCLSGQVGPGSASSASGYCWTSLMLRCVGHADNTRATRLVDAAGCPQVS
jgi:hypothetical protein